MKAQVKHRKLLFLLYVVLTTVNVACSHDCGDDPLNIIRRIAKSAKGASVAKVLQIMKELDHKAYKLLAHRYKLYTVCMGSVEGGYFRRRRATVSYNRLREIREARRGENRIVQLHQGYKRYNLATNKNPGKMNQKSISRYTW